MVDRDRSGSAPAPARALKPRADWLHAAIPGETVIDMIEKGLIVDHPFDRLALQCAAGRCSRPCCRSCDGHSAKVQS